MMINFKQKYITVPLAIAYWFIPLGANASSDTVTGYILFGMMLSIGALKDLGE